MARTPHSLKTTATVVVVSAIVGLLSCGGPTPPPPPPCDRSCQDATALRGLRETIKLAFNLTLQGKPVGEHDETLPCIRGGSARVYGTAASNAEQGSTEVDLTYELRNCGYLFQDDDAEENYDLTFTGTLTQTGVIAVQPSSSTALLMKSDGMSMEGTVYDPPEPYAERNCVVDVAQNGNTIGGSMCGRVTSFDF